MNLTPLVEQLSIVDKDLDVIPFVPNWAQREYLDVVEEQLSTTGRIRIIVLKARQIGISTLTEAVAFALAFIFDNYKVVVFSHESESSEHILGITNTYWETYPFKRLYTPKHLSRNHIEWRETKSGIRVATAGGRGGGRSKTIHFLHASEVAFWPKPKEVMAGLRQTIPSTSGTAIVLESTANSIGNYFHDTWEKAVAEQNEYIPLFFPWWRHPEYLASYVGEPHSYLGQLDQEEKELVKLFKAEGVSELEWDDRIAWRRWGIKNLAHHDILYFHQEYPSTPEEAFISRGHNVFPEPKLRLIYEAQPGIRGYLVRDAQKATFHHDPGGPLRIFYGPSAGEEYYIGGDPTRTKRGDFACAQVINRYSMEQVAVWHGRIDSATFAEELMKLGLYYNNAYISIEKEGPGELCIGKLVGMNYPKVWRHTKIDRTPGKQVGDTYGWSTTAQTKHIAVGWLLKVVIDRDLLIHDHETYMEMRNYVFEDGDFKPANEDGFDDMVMAMAICVTCHFLDTPVRPYGESAIIMPLTDSESGEEVEQEILHLPWENVGIGDRE